MIQSFYQYGDQNRLEIQVDVEKVLEDLELFESKWSQYNTLKPWIRREGLCVINERGECGPGPALESLSEWNKKNNTNLTELDFNIPTEFYHQSQEIQNALKDILPYCFRTHFLKLKPGGFFPEHRDFIGYSEDQKSLRLIIPIQNCNPGSMRFMIEDRTLQWDMGSMYLVNTNKVHSLFNLNPSEDSIWLVINCQVCKEVFEWTSKNLSIR